MNRFLTDSLKNILDNSTLCSSLISFLKISILPPPQLPPLTPAALTKMIKTALLINVGIIEPDRQWSACFQTGPYLTNGLCVLGILCQIQPQLFFDFHKYFAALLEIVPASPTEITSTRISGRNQSSKTKQKEMKLMN